jgi:phenylpyruvate tautomerase PptA (4-oxalocrotonate tautomerase family)
MPLYEIEHVCPINPHQQQAIADSIVKIHSEIYTMPSLFVNVCFKDANDTPLW